MTHLVLYDGVCGLCQGFVRFLLRIDGREQLRFASLQGPIGAAILERYHRPTEALNTVVVVANHDSESPRLLERSDAALFVLASVGGFYRVATLLRIVPRFLRDAVYDLVARWRYRVFGRLEACPIPSPQTRARFLDFPPAARPR